MTRLAALDVSLASRGAGCGLVQLLCLLLMMRVGLVQWWCKFATDPTVDAASSTNTVITVDAASGPGTSKLTPSELDWNNYCAYC